MDFNKIFVEIEENLLNYVRIPSKAGQQKENAPGESADPSRGMSACLRCGCCLAVALRIGEVLVQANHIYEDKIITDPDIIVNIFKRACNGFQDYSLRQKHGYRYLANLIFIIPRCSYYFVLPVYTTFLKIVKDLHYIYQSQSLKLSFINEFYQFRANM